MSKTITIAKRDLFQTIRKPTFWISTLFFPLFVFIYILLTDFQYAQNMQFDKAKETLTEKSILVVDDSSYIHNSLLIDPYYKATDLQTAKQQVENKEVEALFYFPKEVGSENNPIEIYTLDATYQDLKELALNLLRESILLEVEDPRKRQLLEESPSVEVKNLETGSEAKESTTGFIIMIMIFYVLILSLSIGPIIVSLGEEKENKVIEIIISLVKPHDVILGKLLAHVALALIQIIIIASSTFLLLQVSAVISGNPFSFDIWTTLYSLDPWLVLKAFFYLGCAFLITTMLALGASAAMPTTREAQGFISVFFILGLFPFYFMNTLINEPVGTLTLFLSYFPLTSGITLFVRNLLDQISLPELLFGSILLIVYLIASSILAFKLFERGSVEYHRKISLREIFK